VHKRSIVQHRLRCKRLKRATLVKIVGETGDARNDDVLDCWRGAVSPPPSHGCAKLRSSILGRRPLLGWVSSAFSSSSLDSTASLRWTTPMKLKQSVILVGKRKYRALYLHLHRHFNTD
jgi:hypothetical protein